MMYAVDSRIRLWICCIALGASLLLTSQNTSFAAAPTEVLSRWVATSLEMELQRGPTREGMAEIYDRSVRVHGNVIALRVHLKRLLKNTTDKQRIRHLRMAAAHVYWRLGDIDKAAAELSVVIDDATASPDAELLLWRAKLYDALGQLDDARDEYERVLVYTDDKEVEQTIRLRLALMGLMGGGDDDAATLVALAKEQDDTSIRNRAAIVLALQDRPDDALDLFVVEGEGTSRFRSASRVAEWSIRANHADAAREASWDAVQSAQLRRDRRYALTLLVESYRLDDTIGALVERFAERENLTVEEREVWINLLREQERYDEAIALFSASAGDTFDVQMRRDLLEMEREAGREDRMIETYRGLIESEPDELIWRTGLTQVLLERGEQLDAAALWPAYLDGLDGGNTLLQAAQSLASLGLDDLAVRAVERMLTLDVETGPGLLFLSQVHRDRGRLQESEALLDRLNDLAAAGDSARFELAEAYEQLGQQAKAVTVMEGIRDSRTSVAEDLEMRLAWLYSEIGEEDKALDLWLTLWRRINSVPRRRYVEDRLMSVASRLGRLADIAITLEEKLLDGIADEREAGLLVRIYTRVNDPVSATEVLGEYMRQSGASEIDALTENARIYLICEDYFNYEKTIHRMIKVDPEGNGEYLRQLAMSQLERGRPDEARAVLAELRSIEVDDVSREFEAGVLALAGMRDEAAEAYRRGIAEHPDRIESYLLLANMMADLGMADRAVGMFKYLAETTDKDDMFTIAIDGLLNMQAERATVNWARRITLERLAGREDKNYLYQLLADLSEEANDKDGQVRALENSIAIAGTRRLSILRECMDLSSKIRGGVFYAAGRGPTNAGNESFFAFARRLVGLDEAVPPQVFSDLGKAFLDDDQPRMAWQTFSMARNLPDERAYRRDVARIFETAGHREEALRIYERLLRTSPSDVGLLTKVAQLHEQDGHDDVACRFYQQAVDLLIAQAPLTTMEQEEEQNTRAFYYWAANRDAYQTYYDRSIRGLLVTLPDRTATDAYIEAQRQTLLGELEQIETSRDDDNLIQNLASSPRVQKRVLALRRLLIAFDRVADADAIDLDLLQRFPDDKDLLTEIARTRIDWGYYESARRIAQDSGRGDDAVQTVRLLLGETFDDTTSDLLDPQEAMGQLVPLLTAGDRESARSVLRRLNTSSLAASSGGMSFIIINGVAQVDGDDSPPALQFLRIAQRLEDDDLVLRLARGWFKSTLDGHQIAQAVTSTFDQCSKLLEGEHLESFQRHVADLLNEKPERAAANFALLARIDESLSESIIDADVLLEGIEKGKLALSWQFAGDQFLQAAPEEVRVQAFEQIVQNTQEGQRLQPLLNTVFMARFEIGEDLARVIENYFAGDLRHAKEAGRLNYIGGMIPDGSDPLRTIANGEIARRMLDAMNDFVPTNERDSLIARGILIARQLGDEQWLQQTLDLYETPDPGPEAYSARRARSELFRMAMKAHPEAFLARLDERELRDGKSSELTDERVNAANMIGDISIQRATYTQAAVDHPDERKYLNALENLDRRDRRYRSALAVNEQILELILADAGDEKAELTRDQLVTIMVNNIMEQTGGAIAEAEIRLSIEQMADAMTVDEFKQQLIDSGIEIPKATGSATLATRRKIATLWSQLEHPAKSLEAWRAVHAMEQTKFEEASVPENATVPDQAAAAIPASGMVRMVPATAIGTAGISAAAAAAAVQDETEDSMIGVRQAVESETFEDARKMLRRLWRTYPSDDNRMVFYGGMSGMASLLWPTDDEMPSADEDNTEPDEPSAEEKATRQKELRAIRRGGLDVFRPREKATPVQRDSAWKTLSSQSFGVDEMSRVLRSRTAREVRTIKPVILGLLEARRGSEGDEKVRNDLLNAVRSGQAGQTSLIQLFALLNESPELLGPDEADLLDDLVRTLEPDETRMLSRIAWLYARLGAYERASNLYEYCASRAVGVPRYYFWNPFSTDQTVSLRDIIKEVRETFEGDELIQVIERIFAATDISTDANILLAAETWTELLDADAAVQRLKVYFDDLDDYSNGIRRGAAVRGASLFAHTGSLDDARRCLRAALITVKTTELPEEMRWSYWGRNEIPGSLHEEALFQIFPEDMADIPDGPAWLSIASEEMLELVHEDRLEAETALRPLIVIALRMNELQLQSQASVLLTTIIELTDETTRRADRLLLLDVLRTCGMTEQAVQLAQAMHDEDVLPVQRLGDLVRDTAALHDVRRGLALADTLLPMTNDQDLLDVAIEFAADPAMERDAAHYTTLLEQSEQAREEISALRKDISQWKKQLEQAKGS